MEPPGMGSRRVLPLYSGSCRYDFTLIFANPHSEYEHSAEHMHFTEPTLWIIVSNPGTAVTLGNTQWQFYAVMRQAVA
jgi:hypothetical protein